jgi:hypothetical protein
MDGQVLGRFLPLPLGGKHRTDMKSYLGIGRGNADRLLADADRLRPFANRIEYAAERAQRGKAGWVDRQGGACETFGLCRIAGMQQHHGRMQKDSGIMGLSFRVRDSQPSQILVVRIFGQ